ncbi:desmoplakin-like [Colias croceus]|uniref:desmoplakin-like n=1 Tax=Colias crocea TaxID=72248 RepID=UPI001E27D68C|nr:desmoplakin-like [Colias croceus]
MHYGNYLFLALLCIFQPIISKGNIVDGRESRSVRSIRFELSDRRSYRDVRERFLVSSPNKLSPDHHLIRDDRRGRSSLRNNLERVDTILHRNTRAIRQLKTNEIRSQRLSRYQDRIIPDVRSINDRTFDDASRNVRFERGTALLDTRKIASTTERVDANENKLSRSREISKNARSRSVYDLKQSERRISQNRFSPERNIDISRDVSERSHNVERRFSNAYHRRQETRQKTNVLPNRPRSLGREQTREMRIRNDDNLVRKERRISIENRRNVDKRIDIPENLKNINSRRISQNRFSAERNIDISRDVSERSHNVERRSSNAYHRRQETRQKTNVLPNRSRSLGREQTREMRSRNDDNLVRKERRISIENRRNVVQRIDIPEDLRNINSQRRGSTPNREEVRDRFERTVRGRYTRSRSLTRSKLRNSVAGNMHERNINNIREKRELERLGGDRRSEARRESRSLSMEIRDMERDFAGRQYARNSKAVAREIQGISEMRKPSRTLSRLNIRDTRCEDRERVSRSELRERSKILFREAERTASRHERRNNMLRDTDEYGSRFEVSRNLINSFKSEEKTGMMNWQILFYTLQGIYLCSILVKAMNKNDYSMKKTRSFGWLPLSTAMKID